MALDYATLNALTNEWATERANLDDRENRLRINYNNVLDRMRRELGKNQLTLSENLSDRGMLHSGPAAKASTDITDTYNRARAEAAQNQNLDLGTIARQRIMGDFALNSQRLAMQIPTDEDYEKFREIQEKRLKELQGA